MAQIALKNILYNKKDWLSFENKMKELNDLNEEFKIMGYRVW